MLTLIPLTNCGDRTTVKTQAKPLKPELPVLYRMGVRENSELPKEIK
jgi:hypothetical protein